MKRTILLLTALALILFAGCSPAGGSSEHSESVPESSSSAPVPSEDGPSGDESAAPAPSSEASDSSESSEVPPEPEPSREDQILAGMTTEQKVGQLLFLIYSRADTPGAGLVFDEAARAQFAALQPGGLVLFKENVGSVDQLRALIGDAKASVDLPLFVSVDQEGGAVQRITATDTMSATVLPPMMRVGRTGDADLARRVGRVIGTELSVFGFNMDFAPVCDVFSNPNNTVIGNRAFSSEPETAAAMSTALSQGLTETGILPVAKHFPGHGDTAEDSHKGAAVNYKTLDELRETELIPFRRQIDAGVPAIMIAHISLPAVLGDDTPATLSKEIVTGLLREEMGFDGLVITDSLVMGAIANRYDGATAALMAIEAGCDMLLCPEDPAAAHAALLAAVRDGTLSEERLDASVRRILRAKLDGGLFDDCVLNDPSVLGCAEHRAVVAEIEEKQP